MVAHFPEEEGAAGSIPAAGAVSLFFDNFGRETEMPLCCICGGYLVPIGHQTNQFMECQDCGAEINPSGDDMTTVDEYIELYQETGGEG